MVSHITLIKNNNIRTWFVCATVAAMCIPLFLCGNAAGAIGETLETDDVIATGPIADVRAFGAVGDGYTDNQAAFQAANDFLVDGGTIRVPKGKFFFAGSVNLSANVNVVGMGAPSIIRCRNMLSGFAAFDISGEGNRIKDLVFKGIVENKNGSTAIDVSGSDVAVENCSVEGFQSGVVLSGTNVRLSNSSISGSYQSGVYLYSLHGGAIDANTISGCGSSGIKGAEDAPGGPGHNTIEDLLLSNNICAGNGVSGIELTCGMSGVKLDNNICRDNSAYGIQISIPSEAVQDGNVLVRNNSCYQNVSDGLFVYRLDQAAIIHNRCYQNSGSGIVCFGIINSNISGNLLVENGSHGLKFSGSSGDESALLNVTANVCFDNGDGANDYGIYVEKYSEQMKLVSNTALNQSSSNQTSGIRVENAATANIITKNNFSPNDKVSAGRGVVVQGPANSGHDNEVTQGGISGLEVNGTTPGVHGGGLHYTQNTVSTTVTSFIGGTSAQVIRVLFLDNNTTIKHEDSSIVLAGELDWSPGLNDSLTLMYRGGRWLELGRSEK